MHLSLELLLRMLFYVFSIVIFKIIVTSADEETIEVGVIFNDKTATLTCSLVKLKEVQTVLWEFNNNPILRMDLKSSNLLRRDRYKSFLDNDGQSVSLMIAFVSFNDAGNYSCTIFYSHSGKVRTTKRLFVQGHPVLHFDDVIMEGEHLSANCCIQSAGKSTQAAFLWLIHNRNIQHLTKQSQTLANEMEYVTECISITFQVDRTYNKGTLTCLVLNEINDTADATINVLFNSSITLLGTKPNIIPKDDDFELTCQTDGNPAPNVSLERFDRETGIWQEQIYRATVSSNKSSFQIWTFKLHSLNLTNTEKYRCVANNSMGSYAISDAVTIEITTKYTYSSYAVVSLILVILIAVTTLIACVKSKAQTRSFEATDTSVQFQTSFRHIYEDQELNAEEEIHHNGVTVADARRFMAATKMQTSIPNHRNVVALIGMDTEQVPSYTFHEFQEGGNVRDFLSRNCQDITGYNKHCATSVSGTSSQLFHTKLIAFANDVANAMEFLHGHEFYHPAICARKTLLDRHFRCKLFAFWPQEAADEIVKKLLDAYKSPFEWLSPEVISLGDYGTKCDVWSYGVFLWELFSHGDTPYEGENRSRIAQHVRDGVRLQVPLNCPHDISSIMKSVWNSKSHERPAFKTIAEQLQGMQPTEHKKFVLNEESGRHGYHRAQEKRHAYDRLERI
ncbi:uncharacterized protein [Apostichopus japonicus]|uniref:uncharacterized protein isoform X3 n=1 Tax=Stichopus japonicus TaxID=307972 RepID=UPI003AB24D40